MKPLSIAAAAGLGCIILAGCATPTVVETRRVEDTGLSCEQLVAEIHEAERFRGEAEAQKGFTGTNVAAALLFWPALVGTYKNVDDATRAADERKRYLIDVYNEKGCSGRY